MDQRSEDGIPIRNENDIDHRKIHLRLIQAGKRMGVPDNVIEDFAQEAWKELLRKEQRKDACEATGGFNPTKLSKATTVEDGLTLFLIGIMYHKRTDYFRTRSRHPLESIDTGKSHGADDGSLKATEFASDAPSPEDELRADELKKKLLSVIPKKDKDAITLVTIAPCISWMSMIDQQFAEVMYGDRLATPRVVAIRKRIRKYICRAAKTEQRNNGRTLSWLTTMKTMIKPATGTPERTAGLTP